MTKITLPDRQPALRTVAMPSDANPDGDIFGGWVMAQLDIAGGLHASYIARGRVVTVAVKSMSFHLPVFVGDELSCYCATERIGRTSITVRIENWARRHFDGSVVKVTEGLYTYVAMDGNRRPRPVLAEPEEPVIV